MRIVQVQHVYQLTFMPRLFPVNCYLVEEDDGFTLIDAGLPYSAKGIEQAAVRMGKPIMRIVLTHAHEDHVGALDRLKARYPDAQVFISRRDARLLQGDVSLETDEPNTPIRGSVPKGILTRPDVLLEDGDPVGSLLAISTPGHTPGSMAFLDTRTRALIAGDAFQVRGGVAVSGRLKPLFPFPALATWNKESSLESAKKLALFKPSLLAVGHGNMLQHPQPQLERAIMEMEQHLTMSYKG
ncbi:MULTISPECIES: MBL fold metallo-hydrolase [Paenibacillus]|uniref:Glyoxylase-like metal-dependent hydrolase (Beta-lactamase superfamily II) n=1 Tax=Paenibacillus brasilensis TaxID=128574 RepID=A0ABU0L667_9BACL|nr:MULTISPECIES: MBL fold metallo-hydrolase [Paenibacillus]MDQ0496762.1 glyoxylase-like metal-dependent hydrolase (beta-lactamase superfamily II) [Paenibacillus brasilensis]